MRFFYSALAVVLASLATAQAHRFGSSNSGSPGSSLPPHAPRGSRDGSHDGLFNGKPFHGHWHSGSGSHQGDDAGQTHHNHWPAGHGDHHGSREDAEFQPGSGPHEHDRPHLHDGSHWRDAGSFSGEMKPPGGVHCGRGGLRGHGSNADHAPGSGCGHDLAPTAPPS